MSRVISLTQSRVESLPLGSGTWRDEQVKGLLVRCHATTRTYSVQGDVWRNGRKIRTVKVKIDRCDRIGLRDARRRARELMSAIQSGIDPNARPDESGITLKAMFERYLADRTLAASTTENYKLHVDKYLARWKNRALVDISRVDVRDLYDDLRKRSGQTTASGVMRTLRAIINDARRYDETITANPVDVIRIPMPRPRDVQPIDLRAWWQRVNELPPIRRDYHVTLMFTGLRRRSATTIKRADLHLDRGIVRVRHMKSQKPFLLPLSDFLIAMLEVRLRDDEAIGSDWLWHSPNSKSGHLEEPRAEGLPSAHEYRHLWRTNAIAAGVPYAESALLLDHRLPGASGGYVHAEHLAQQLRQFQQQVTDYLVAEAGIELQPRLAVAHHSDDQLALPLAF